MESHEQTKETDSKRDGKTQDAYGDFWGGFASGVDVPSVTRDIMHGGKDIDQQLAQSVFANNNELNRLLQFLIKVERYECDPRYAKIILRRAKGTAAIKGRGRMEALMAHSQVFAPSVYTGRPGDDIKKSRFRMFRKKKKDKEDEDEEG